MNCKQKEIFIQYSQRVLYVHARRVLSIYTCMIFILRETRTTVHEWACWNLPFFFADQTSNMVDMGNACFWLVKIRKISSLKLQGQMKYNLVGIMYGRSRKQIPNFVPIILKTWLSWKYLLVIGRGKVIRWATQSQLPEPLYKAKDLSRSTCNIILTQ